MSKANPKHRNFPKRLNPSKFNIVEATTADAGRYVTSFSRLVYSYEVVRDKKNTQQVRQIEARNLEVQKLSRRFVSPSEEEFFTIIQNNVHVLFFVKDSSLDCGFAIVNFSDDKSAYISDLTVFKHLLGMGTLFYQMLENHLKNCGFTKITLKSPFEGSKPFWRKMGFTPDAGSSIAYHKFL